MQLTQKIKIEVTPAQEIVLSALSEKCRLIYNFALKERKDAFEKQVKGITYLKQQNDLPALKEKYPEYRWVNSKVLQFILRTLDADYKSFFALKKNGDGDAEPPHFKGKNFFTTMTFNQSGFKFGKGFAELSHKHPLGTKLWFRIPEKFIFSKVYQVSIYKKEREYFISIIFEKPEQAQQDNGQYQAFDLGVMKQTAVNLQGKFKEFAVERPDRYWQKPISELQSRQDHCKKNSGQFKELHRLLNKCQSKSANQSKDFQHKLAKRIIDNTKATTIVVGDLAVKEMSQLNKYQKGLHKSLQNTGSISRFVGFLTYKATLVGKRIVEISERDTSKRCCCCGRIKDMPLSERVYVCECGNRIDRDKNSAVNIMLRFLSQNGLWTAYWQFVSNLRHTGLTIVSHSEEAHSSASGET